MHQVHSQTLENTTIIYYRVPTSYRVYTSTPPQYLLCMLFLRQACPPPRRVHFL